MKIDDLKKNHQLRFTLIVNVLVLYTDVNSLFFYVYFASLLLYFLLRRNFFFKYIKYGLTLFVIPASYYLAGSFKSVEFACVLLSFLSLLKYMEIRSVKDFQNFLLIYILYFSATTMLASQVLTFLLGVICIASHFVILIKLQGFTFNSFNFKRFFSLVLLSFVPIAFFFVVIPQIGVGGFGNLSNRQSTAGISNELSPGSLWEIAKDTSIHLVLDTKQMKKSLLSSYWRIYTFEVNDGKNWSASTPVELDIIDQVPVLTVNDLTKSNHPKIKNNYYSSNVESLTRNLFLSKMKTYKLYQSKRREVDLSKSKFDKNTNVKKSSSELRDFVRDIKGETNTLKFEAVINKLKSLNLSYSTSKTEINSDDMSDFLFRSKRGYCEHFASSAAIILRMLNVPARVVVGYFGGRYNPRDKLIFITGQNAHAWIEYHDGTKWIEEDPVERVISSSVLPDNDFELYFKEKDEHKNFNFDSLISDIYVLYMTLNYNFFKYDLDVQKQLFLEFKEYILINKVKILFSFFGLLIFFIILNTLFISDKKLFKMVQKYLHDSGPLKIENILQLSPVISKHFYDLYLQKKYSTLVNDKKLNLQRNIKLILIKFYLNFYLKLEAVKKATGRLR